jgi:hypothetical protein
MKPNRSAATSLGALAMLALSAWSAQARDWPARPIKLILGRTSISARRF